MCRWIVYIGHQGLMLEDLLIKPNNSIVDQVNQDFLPGLYYGLDKSDKKELLQGEFVLDLHGFGVAWYTDNLSQYDSTVKGLRPALYKTVAPISTDLAFSQLCAQTASTCTLAHIRAASFPPVVQTNNHPFLFGKYSFMHNGAIDSFNIIRFDVLRRIYYLQEFVNKFPAESKISSVPDGNYIFNIQGNTDTEHLATLFFVHLDIIKAAIISGNQDGRKRVPFDTESTDAMLLALILAIADIHQIQARYSVGPFTPGNDRATNYLNLCIMDGGVQMVVCRWRDSKEGYPLSLYLSLTAGASLNRKYNENPVIPLPERNLDLIGNVPIDSVEELVKRYQDLPPTPQGKHVIVSSEPCTLDIFDWGLFGQNQVVTVSKDDKLRMIDLPKFFAPDREQAFQKYGFSDVLDNIKQLNETDPQPDIGIPQVTLDDLPNAFETELELK